MKNYTEEALIGLALGKQDQSAFGQLVMRHQSVIRNALRQLTNWDEPLADDLAQETFIQAFKKLHQFNGKAKFSSWLYRIAYNQFLQYCRSQSSQKNQAELQELDAQQHEHRGPLPIEDEAQSQLQKQLAAVLAQIEPQRRCVLHLLLYKQCTQQEIADIMKIPLGTVKTHINRGRADLKIKLAHWQNS